MPTHTNQEHKFWAIFRSKRETFCLQLSPHFVMFHGNKNLAKSRLERATTNENAKENKISNKP